MARTNRKWVRVYKDGYDFSGVSRAIGPLSVEHAWGEFNAFSDPIKNGMTGQTTFGCGALDVVFDNTATTGVHILTSTPAETCDVMVAVGFQAAPTQGDPVFCIQPTQGAYQSVTDDVIVTATIPFLATSNRADTVAYNKAWSRLLRAATATTAVNSAVGIDDAAATTAGGYMCYQVIAGNGTATIKVQDAAVNNDGGFADLSGATTGSINCAVVQSGIVALATTATVRQFLRWQVVFGAATTVTFVLTFVRG